MRKRRNTKISLLVILLVAIASLAWTPPAERYFEIARSLDIFSTLFKEINAHYVDEVNPRGLITQGINGMLESLDPYTRYIPEEEIEAFSIQTTGQYAGIGALIGVIDKRTVVTHPYYGFPAYLAGIRVGDEFISVNGNVVKGKPTSEVSTFLKGKPKTSVDLILRRNGVKDDIKLTIQRERIKITNVVYQGLITPHIGYIKLDDFTPGAGKEISDALTKLKSEGATSVILDLRDNPGGLLYEAVNICGVFIPKGSEVVATKGKIPDWNKSYVTLNEPLDTQIPLAVLTSGSSASAAEIVAGALQDYDRAVLIGQRTFGKGLVQTTRQLSYQAQLKVTTARYYIPSGRCIQALDYAHRKSDGTVDRFADSLRHSFKTTRGREVFDGGGLDPDIHTDEFSVSSPVADLITSGLFFEYATIYCSTNPAPASVRAFRITSPEYQKFQEWLKARNFVIRSGLERRADEMIKSASRENFDADLNTGLEELKRQIQASNETGFTRFQKEISYFLEQEIAFHYSLNAGRVESTLDRDDEIVRAVQLLSENSEYRKLLQPH